MTKPLFGNQPSSQTVAEFAESLLKAYVARNGDILPVFAAYVGLVFQRDEAVGRDCLIALDRLVNDDANA